MPDNDQPNEGQGPLEADQSPTKSAPAESQSALGQIGDRVKQGVHYVNHLSKTRFGIFIMVFVAIMLFVLLLTFGGVWASAIKGYFGERLHQDAGGVGEDPERTAVVERKKNSPHQLGIPTGPVAPPGGPCDFVVPDKLDSSFLESGYTFTKSAIGAPEGTHIEPDDAMVTTMDYLCKKHSRLGISHIISAYVNMQLDPEQLASRDPQIIKNISAHNRGQAYDLVEIDYVYKVFRTPCPGTPNWNIEYWNDQNQLLLAFPCREPLSKVNTNFAGGLATAIPIRAIWQDQPNQFALGGLPLNIDSALRTMAAYLGLSPDALRYMTGSLDGSLVQIGRVYLEELLGLPAGALYGNDLSAILESTFGAKLAEVLGQLPRFDWGATFPDWVNSAGAGWWEERLGLFPGSFQGWSSSQDLFRSVGLETAAAILRVPSPILGDAAAAGALAGAYPEADLKAFGDNVLGSRLLPILNALKQGNQDALNLSLQSYGKQILALSFGLPEDAFDPCAGRERDCTDPFSTVSQVAERSGISEGDLRAFLDTAIDGGSFTGLFQVQGAPLLSSALGLPEGVVAQLLAGQSVNLDATTIDVLASRLGVDTAIAEQLLAAIGQGQELLSMMQEVGSAVLAQAMDLSDPLALFEVATGTAGQDLINRVTNELARLSETLNLPLEIVNLQELLSGNLDDFLGVFEGLAGIQLGDIFGLDLTQIEQLVGGNLSVLLNLPQFQGLAQSIFEALGLNLNELTGLLQGSPLVSQLASVGDVLNGAMSVLGLDQWLIMERVYRPEARRKVHLVLEELLEMPFTLDDIDLRVTQLITGSYERDVQPFEADGTLDRVYGKSRSKNFGLFAMKEAFDHIHIGY